MKIKTIIFSSLSLFVLCACKGGDTDPDQPQSGKWAPDVYWESSYSGPKGIQLGTLPSDATKPRMYLGGELLYVTGTNCYNLFVQCHESDNLNTSEMELAVKEISDGQVPIVRFSCSPFYDHQMHWYFDQKEKYLANLDKLGTLCDQYHILLIPSVFWNTSCMPTYYGEDIMAWGDKDSQTYKFMLQYTKEIVDVLKSHKSLAAWEFGNEFNLAADIDIAGYPELPASCVETAYKGFAEVVSANDPEKRMICTGNSIMRDAQWHLANQKNWSTDSFKEYVEITSVMSPAPMTGMSEHIYEDSRKFSDLGTLNRTQQVIKAKECAAQLGQAFYVGEFTGPKTVSGDTVKVKSHFSTYLSQKVQISLIWNYALRGNIEYSFKATDYNGAPFSLIRRYNANFKKMSPEK